MNFDLARKEKEIEDQQQHKKHRVSKAAYFDVHEREDSSLLVNDVKRLLLDRPEAGVRVQVGKVERGRPEKGLKVLRVYPTRTVVRSWNRAVKS